MGIIIVLLMVVCGIGLYRGHLGVGYALCTLVLGLFLAATPIGQGLLQVMHPVGGVVSSTTNSLNH